MPKYIVSGDLHFNCCLETENLDFVARNADATIWINGKVIKIELHSDTPENCRAGAEIISENVCKWLSLVCNTMITANMTSVKDEEGRISVNINVDTCRSIILTKKTLEKGLESIKNNLPLVINPSENVALALGYITLGNNLMNSNIPFRHRYAILEFSRAVEMVLGEWKRQECEDELLERGWDNLVEHTNWLFNIRGDGDVAHASKKYKATEADCNRARKVAIMVILEETGYNVSLQSVIPQLFRDLGGRDEDIIQS